MPPSSHTSRTLVIILIIAILAGLAFLAYSHQKSPVNSGPGNQDIYTLNTTYIHTVDWPPQVQTIEGPFSCTTAGQETARAGITEQRTINGWPYCVTRESEGAAGTTYTQYAYAFPKNDKVTILTFTLKAVQCGNYDDPQKSACEAERQAFDIDGIIDRIARTVQ